MNKQKVSDPTLLRLENSSPAVSCTKSFYASSHASSNSQDVSSVEADYVHLLVEAEASEVFEGSNSCIRSYGDGEYNRVLRDRETVLANVANVARNWENQAFSCSEKRWNVYAARLMEGKRMYRDCPGPIRKRRRVY